MTHPLPSVHEMAPTPHNRQATVDSDTSVLAVATSLEKNTVLEQILGAHSELIEEAEGLVSGLLSSANAEETADDVTRQLGSLGFEELAGRAGRIPQRCL